MTDKLQLAPSRLNEILLGGKRTKDTLKETTPFLEAITAKLSEKLGANSRIVQKAVGAGRAGGKDVDKIDEAWFCICLLNDPKTENEHRLDLSVKLKDGIHWGVSAWGSMPFAEAVKKALTEVVPLNANEEVKVVPSAKFGGGSCSVRQGLTPAEVKDLPALGTLVTRISDDLANWHDRLAPHLDTIRERFSQPVKQYWAGGHMWDGKDAQKDRFIAGNIWEMGWERSAKEDAAKRAWSVFDRIKVGDEFLIKGYGGRNNLVVYYVGRVKSVDSQKGRLELEKLDRPLYSGQAPRETSSGPNPWFGTLVEVRRPENIDLLFHGKQPPPNRVIKTVNMILYGPPGTGKTYHTVDETLKICAPEQCAIWEKQVEEAQQNQEKKNAIRKEMEDAFRTLIRDGRVGFVTFHQTYGYEDFVEGIRPWLGLENNGEVDYVLVDGILKQLAIEATHACLDSQQQEDIPLFNAALRAFQEHHQVGSKLATVQKQEFMVGEYLQTSIRVQVKAAKHLYSLSYAPLQDMFSADRKQPFTSPGDLAERNGFAGLASYYYPVVKKLAEYAKNIDPKSTPAPAIAGDDRERRYAAKKKSVLDMLADPTPFTVRNGPNYVLVIDEINRGNISKIMGELITLLEDDKRLGAAHELRVQLPCSKEWFCLPPNLHIIGTMNTADRSIALMDVALRRRFNKYEELMPNPSLVPDYARPYFEAINNHIEYFFDRDHQIGHSYFMQADSAKALRDALCDKVVPLLQEYFYGAWDKVCMVLGCPHDRNADGEPCIVKCTPIKVRADDEDSEPKLRFEIDKDFREATSDSEIERYLNRILPQGGQG